MPRCVLLVLLVSASLLAAGDSLDILYKEPTQEESERALALFAASTGDVSVVPEILRLVGLVHAGEFWPRLERAHESLFTLVSVCHVYGHVYGHVVYQMAAGNVSVPEMLQACSQTCGGVETRGCVHGVLGAQAEETYPQPILSQNDVGELLESCETFDDEFLHLQCYHGAGHFLVEKMIRADPNYPKKQEEERYQAVADLLSTTIYPNTPVNMRFTIAQGAYMHLHQAGNVFGGRIESCFVEKTFPFACMWFATTPRLTDPSDDSIRALCNGVSWEGLGSELRRSCYLVSVASRRKDILALKEVNYDGGKMCDPERYPLSENRLACLEGLSFILQRFLFTKQPSIGKKYCEATSKSTELSFARCMDIFYNSAHHFSFDSFYSLVEQEENTHTKRESFAFGEEETADKKDFEVQFLFQEETVIVDAEPVYTRTFLVDVCVGLGEMESACLDMTSKFERRYASVDEADELFRQVNRNLYGEMPDKVDFECACITNIKSGVTIRVWAPTQSALHSGVADPKGVNFDYAFNNQDDCSGRGTCSCYC